MTLTELKYAIALANYKHFKLAAEHCYVTQPTLSVAIKKLETELNVTLFERQKHKVLITPIGKNILKIAEEILQKTDDISHYAENLTNSFVEIKIGAIYTIGPYLFPKLIPLIHQKFPSIKLIIEENYTSVLSEKLQKGELDIIFISLPFVEKNIQTHILYSEKFVAAMSSSHPFATKNKIDLKEIKNETLLLLGQGHCFRDQVLETYPNLKENPTHHQHWSKILEGSSLETIKYMVASGTGMTILPQTSILQNKILTTKELISPVPYRTVALACRTSFYQVSFINQIVQLIKSMPLEGTYQ